MSMLQTSQIEQNPERAYVFFALLMLVSMPFWLLGAIIENELLPGLPVSAAMAIAPACVAGYLRFQEGGWRALQVIISQAVDGWRMPLWAWAFALFTLPFVMLLCGIVQIAHGTSLPAPEWSWPSTLKLFALFLVAGIAEELGWTGFAARSLAMVRGIVFTGLIIGVVSVLWHAIPLVQAGRDFTWILWWAVGSVSRRMLLTWLYVNGGHSVFGAGLMHAMANLSWFLFPVMGSHYDPTVVALVTLFLASALLSIDGLRRWGLTE